MNPRDVCLQSVYADIEIGIRTSGENGVDALFAPYVILTLPRGALPLNCGQADGNSLGNCGVRWGLL